MMWNNVIAISADMKQSWKRVRDFGRLEDLHDDDGCVQTKIAIQALKRYACIYRGITIDDKCGALSLHSRNAKLGEIGLGRLMLAVLAESLPQLRMMVVWLVRQDGLRRNLAFKKDSVVSITPMMLRYESDDVVDEHTVDEDEKTGAGVFDKISNYLRPSPRDKIVP